MKRLTIVAILVIALIGGVALGELNNTYSFKCGDFSSELASTDVGLVNITAIPNADVAVAIATSIAESSHLIGQDSEISVLFDESSETWIVSFDENPMEIGGELYIALNMNNAQVVKVWFEE